jgi:serine/threonine protein phosphatase PrpC
MSDHRIFLANVGDPATYVIGSDQYAGKLIAVSATKHRVTWVRHEESTGVTNTGMTKEFTRRRNGTYYAIGSKYGYLKIGVAKTILDECF